MMRAMNGMNGRTHKHASPLTTMSKLRLIMRFDVLVIDLITPGSHHYAALDIVAMLGMFNNVLPNPDNIIWPGPYWFFGLMLMV